MQLPLRLALKPSWRLAWLLVILHAAALGSLVPLELPLSLKLIVASAIAWSGISCTRRYALLVTSRSVCGLLLLSDGGLEARWCNGQGIAATVSGQSTVFPWMIVLMLAVRAREGLTPVVIMPDSLQAEEHRALRSWLRWTAAQQSAELS